MKMKMKFFFFSLLLFHGILQSQTVTIDLSTGKNDNGTLMSAPNDVVGGYSEPDADWSVIRPGETNPVTTRTRHTYSGWSTAILTVTAGIGNQSRWITDVVGWAKTGDYIYTSKSFQIPNTATNANLNFRSLSFVRNWTYLVRTDVFPNTEEEITRTAWMSDGAKGWLNSRSPEVYNKALIPGATYKIKVRVYTNNSNVTNALNAQGIVSYTSQLCSTPKPTVNSNVAYCQNDIALPLTATGSNLLWYMNSTGGTGSPVAPIPDTSVSGTTLYYVSQTENGCESPRANITVTVNPGTFPTFTQIAPICIGSSFTLPGTSINGITGTWSPVINNQATTTYTFTPTAGQCATKATMTVAVNSQVNPTFTQVDPICKGSGFTLPTTSINGITGTWSPAINNQATTTYTFTPTAGQCANAATMTVTVTSTQFAGELIGMNAVNVNSQSTYTISNAVNGTWSSSNTSVGTINASTGEFTALSVGTTIISFMSSGCSNGVSKNVEVVNCNTPTVITFNLSTGKKGNNIFYNNNDINLLDISTNDYDDDWKLKDNGATVLKDAIVKPASPPLPSGVVTYPFSVNNTSNNIYPTYISTRGIYNNTNNNTNYISRNFYIPSNSYNRRMAIQGFVYRMSTVNIVANNNSSILSFTPTGSNGGINNNWSWYSQNPEYNTCKKIGTTTTAITDCSVNSKGEVNSPNGDKYLINGGEYYFDIRSWGADTTHNPQAKYGVIVEYTIDDLCIQVPYGETSQAFCYGATVSDLVAKNLDATEKDIKWYLSSTGGVALDPFAALTNGIYYAELTFNGVTSLNRLPVKIEILPSANVNDNKDLAINVNGTIQIPVQGVTNGTWQSLDPAVATVSANGLVTGINLGKTAIRYTINNGKCSYDIGVVVRNIDYTLAPNSFIFDINSENDGLYIPVKKAYAMWRDTNGLLNDPSALTGVAKAEVYWEDVSGLVRSAEDYSLSIVDAGENAKIKVHVDKSKGKGNAVVAYKINDKIVWSWHIWVTDDPTNGVNYGHVSDNDGDYTWVKNARYEAGSISKTFIPKWMDRNLGATNRDFIGKDWFKSGGLSYQWGRKDPFPSFIYKNGATNEVSGTIGVKKHLYDYTKTNTQILDQVNRPYDAIEGNIKYSVNNPLVYIHSENGIGWFVNDIPSGDNNYRKKMDLWGDNSENSTATTGGAVNSFKPKKPYDPCPNGWRIPSHLNNTAASTNHFSPWGRNRWKFWDNVANTGDDTEAGYNKIKPTAVNAHLEGVKIYANLGMDFTNAYTTSAMGSGKMSRNMGVYPGGGKYKLSTSAQKVYIDDTHEIAISTATIWNLNTANTYFMYGYADAGQEFDMPDNASYPNMIGRYYLNPGFESGAPKGANSCRCIEDKYAFIYDFPTQFFKETNLLNYTEGISNPNSYAVTKGTAEQEIKIPVSKAFSVYNQHLSDHGMLEFNNLKTNVYWTDNKALISNVKIINAPSSVSNIKDAYISVKIPANQSGNAVVSLHNGSIDNPVYWSWHIWVTNNAISEVKYQTEDVLLPPDANYVNFTNSGAQPMSYSFMDRNLGAIEAFPDVTNPANPSSVELEKIRNSAGLQFQWGKKDPIPSFRKVGISFNSDTIEKYSIWKSSGPDTSGNISQSSFAEITDVIYDNTYVKKRDVDYGTSGNNKREKLRNNLKYASENPLAFLIPGNIYNPLSGFTGKYGQDWLYFESNQMPERWGNASEKSVFDPCPSGYRIPFISNGVFLSEGSVFASKFGKGSSPWYNGFYKSSSSVDPYKLFDLGVQQHVGVEIKNPADIYNGSVPYYLGTTVKSGSSVYGFIFNSNQDTTSNPNAKYKIGNYPITGTRGYNQKSASLSGLWTASMQSNNGFGKGFNLLFHTPNFATSNLQSLVVDDPANALNCRCVKDDFYFGKTLEIASNTGNVLQVTEKRYLNEKTTSVEYVYKEIVVYPNPVTSVLNIKVSDNKDYYYKIYNMSGQLVKQGKFVNKQTDLSSLISGAYLVKINDSESVVKIIKK